MNPFRSLAVAVSFLTWLPAGTGEPKDADFGASVTWFPAVGLGIGALLVAVAHLLEGQVRPELVGTVLVTLCAIVSGGLHLDGLADTFDAVGGGRGDRTRMLAIMKDSHIGAHGTLAIAAVFLAKVLSLSEVLESGGLPIVLVFPAVGRWAVVPLVVLCPYARETGLGRAFNGHGRAWHAMAATGWLVTIVIAIVPGFWPAVIGAAVATVVLAAWMLRRLGGLTGDIYGATVELAEVSFLFCAALRATSTS